MKVDLLEWFTKSNFDSKRSGWRSILSWNPHPSKSQNLVRTVYLPCNDLLREERGTGRHGSKGLVLPAFHLQSLLWKRVHIFMLVYSAKSPLHAYCPLTHALPNCLIEDHVQSDIALQHISCQSFPRTLIRLWTWSSVVPFESFHNSRTNLGRLLPHQNDSPAYLFMPKFLTYTTSLHFQPKNLTFLSLQIAICLLDYKGPIWCHPEVQCHR